MTKKEIADKTLEIICKKFKIEKVEISIESTLESFGIDSLDLVEVIFDIEEIFKIIFPDDVAFKFYIITTTSIADFIALAADYIEMVINKNKIISAI